MRTFCTVLLALFTLVSTAQTRGVYESDVEVGRKNAAMVEFQYGILDDAEKQAYVNAVGQRLVQALDTTYFPYSFEIIPEVSPNAFALPGGFCFVTTGLLELISTEGELAGVLAHEIIHAQNRHGMKLQKKGLLPSLLSVPGAIVGTVSSDLGGLINAPLGASSALVMARYGRGFETEADVEGVKLAVKAGYSADDLISALAKLEQVVELITGEEEKKSYFNDHPITEVRIERLQEISATMKANPRKPLGNLVEEMEGLPVGSLPEYGVVDDNTLIMPVQGLKVTFTADFEMAAYAKVAMAVYEKNNAAFAVSELSDTTTMKEAIDAVQKDLSKLDKHYLQENGAYQWNDYPGYKIRFIDPNSRNGMQYAIRWIDMGDRVVQLVAMAPTGYTQGVEAALKSLAPLTEEDKGQIRHMRMVRVSAREGENIEILSARVDNKLNAELTGLINEYPLQAELAKGTLIRVVQATPYF